MKKTTISIALFTTEQLTTITAETIASLELVKKAVCNAGNSYRKLGATLRNMIPSSLGSTEGDFNYNLYQQNLDNVTNRILPHTELAGKDADKDSEEYKRAFKSCRDHIIWNTKYVHVSQYDGEVVASEIPEVDQYVAVWTPPKAYKAVDKAAIDARKAAQERQDKSRAKKAVLADDPKLKGGELDAAIKEKIASIKLDRAAKEKATKEEVKAANELLHACDRIIAFPEKMAAYIQVIEDKNVSDSIAAHMAAIVAEVEAYKKTVTL